MKRLTILTTGGTIAMTHTDAAGGAIPILGGADFLNALPRDLAEIRVEEFSNLPSAHFTIDHIWNLSRRVAALVARDNVDGVVVTHGTDTLDESAYLCDITIDTPKPVVFTGAMRAASDPGYEGVANLIAAIQTTASDDARACGALVVFNDEIHSARDVTKTHTTALETFLSPEWGPIGRVYADRAVIARKPTRREFIPAPRLEPNVTLLKLAVGMSEGLLEYLVDVVGARGIVLETLGGGRVPPWWLPSIERAVKADTAIVITSRVGAGRTLDRYGYAGAHRDLAQSGCWFVDGLNGQKARIKLMAALGTENARAYFV
ncbi:MAG: asparaginase [Anaerolineales bacterium]|nr:asparaginase [Anaerolineales bacterium]